MFVKQYVNVIMTEKLRPQSSLVSLDVYFITFFITDEEFALVVMLTSDAIVSQMMSSTCCRGRCPCYCVHEWTLHWQSSCFLSCFTSSTSGCSTVWLPTTPLCVRGPQASDWYVDSIELRCGRRNKDWSSPPSVTWHVLCRYVMFSHFSMHFVVFIQS